MRLLLALALWWAVMPSASWAQAAGTDPVGDAVANTLKASWDRQGVDEATQTTTWQKIKDVLAWDVSSKDNWLRIARWLGIDVGTSITDGGSTGGGGANGSWDCRNFQYVLDLGGNIIVPGIQLPNPAGYSYGNTIYMSSQGTNDGGLTFNAKQWGAAIKVVMHTINMNISRAELRWTPVYMNPSNATSAPSSYSIVATRPAYINTSGTLIAKATRVFSAQYNSVAWTKQYAGGPPEGWSCDQDVCEGAGAGHWQGISFMNPAQWNIPTHSSLAPNELKNWAANAGDLGYCTLSNDLIRKIAQKAWEAAASQSGYNGAPVGRVEPEDVRHGPKKPTVGDTSNTTPGNLPNPGTPTTPEPEPSPSPTSTATPGPDWTDPGIGPEDPDIPDLDLEWDWGLPDITIDLGSHQCPTYSADFFGHALVLDSHCPFIEQNRAIISAMMILLFTIAAGIIVLRA